MYLRYFTSRASLPLLLISTLIINGCSEDNQQDILDADANGSSSVNNNLLSDTLATLALEALSNDEIEGIYFMREEEKLAHDVYTTLYTQTSQTIFNNIAQSELSHTNAVLELITRYSLTDPVTDNTIGVFQNTALQSLYDSLIAQGSTSLVDALIVGAIIEEIDIIDIQTQLDQYVDNQDITLVYENLIKGSRNHLRAFVKVLSQHGMTYSPAYLSQQLFDDIINSESETN